LGKAQNNQYVLIDNSSSNGTYYYPMGRLPLNNEMTEQLIISKEEGFSLKIRGVFKGPTNSITKLSIEQALSEAWKQGNTEVVNRNHEL
jgi:hypothetical protein